MVPIVIPSRNRPVSLGKVLEYIGKFYPGTEIVIADGSDSSYSPMYDAVVASASSTLDIQHHRYDVSVPMGERMVDVLQRVTSDIIVVGADDDYPVLETLQIAHEVLQRDNDYVLAIGGIIALRMQEDGQFKAKYLHARSIEEASPVARVNNFIQWPYATSYAAVRRGHYIERCARANLNGMPGFGDYTVGFHDCLAGKIKALPDICYFTTTLPIHSKLRRSNRLFYLECPEEVLAIKEHYKATLLGLSGMAEKRAGDIATRMIGTRIAELSTPAIQNRTGFGVSDLFADPVIRQQYACFSDLFAEGTPSRARLVPQLQQIVQGMQFVMKEAVDNAGEPEAYDRLQDMLGAVSEKTEIRDHETGAKGDKR